MCVEFPWQGELRVPWRWKNAGADDLGNWLLEVRKQLILGNDIDLTTAPEAVRWVELEGNPADFVRTLKAAEQRPLARGDSILIIGDSINPESRYKIARSIKGAVTVEAVDLKDLIQFSQRVDLDDDKLLSHVVFFAQSVMTNIGSQDLLKRVETLKKGTAKKPPSSVETAALTLVGSPSYKNISAIPAISEICFLESELLVSIFSTKSARSLTIDDI